MRTWKKFLAGFLASVILAPSLAVPAQAAAPSVTTDESMYVNLDHYGKVEQVNVVKRVDLNGNSQFTDYGSYEKVTNMSNLAQPSVSAQGITWKLPESTGSFFYECALKPEGATLPWNFDVSYKLNGVPADAEKLAGASGTVEISVKAVPNKNAEEYYKNNMLLQAGTMIDMEDTLSIEAPGAQVQTVGKSKLVLFAALPGEETTFTMRIGTKKFETDGLVIMMVPGTLEQMKDIKELKEDKDTVEDSVDAIHDSTNVILGTIESMSAGLKRAQSGLSALDRARGTISSEKDGLYGKADLSLADLSAVAQQTALLVPHLQSAQQMVGDVNGDLNALTKTVGEAKPYLDSLDSSIGKIQDDVKNLRDVLDDVEDASGDREALLDGMDGDIERARDSLTTLQPILGSLSQSLAQLSAQMDDVIALLKMLAGSGDTEATVQAALLEKTKAVIDSTNGLVAALGAVCGQADEYLDTADETVGLADDTFDALDDGADAADSMLKHSNRLGDSAQSLLRLGETLIDQTSALNGTMNRYEPETVAALKDAEELARRLTSALNSSNAFLSSFESAMKASDGDLDAGSRDSLNGMIDVLGKSLDGISQTSVIKKANDTIKNSIDRETDKYEDDSNLLNLDAEAKPVSFTSEKNPSPESIQIILRTEEISAEDEEKSTEDLEKEKEKTNPFQRMLNVFQKIWQSVIDAFKEA